MLNLPPEVITPGSRPQLFLDREGVEELDQVWRVVQQPRRYEKVKRR